MGPLNQIHTQKDGAEIIPSHLVIPSRLKKSPYKSGIFPSPLLSRPTSHITSPCNYFRLPENRLSFFTCKDLQKVAKV